MHPPHSSSSTSVPPALLCQPLTQYFSFLSSRSSLIYNSHNPQRHQASRIDLLVNHQEGLRLEYPHCSRERRLSINGFLLSGPTRIWAPRPKGCLSRGFTHLSLLPRCCLCLQFISTFSPSSGSSETFHTLASDVSHAYTISMGEWLIKKEKL